MKPDSPLLLARIAHPVRTLGPGRRLALWVAGCPLHCPGCISPELQSLDAGKPIPVPRLARHILALEGPLEGLSLTGGEPFAQPEPLAALWDLIAAERPHWDLLVFSGYTLPRLRRRDETRRLLQRTDLLIAGPYRADLPATAPLLASANQRFHSLTPRGEAMRRVIVRSAPAQAELGILPDGAGLLIGIVDPQRRRRLHEGLRASAEQANGES